MKNELILEPLSQATETLLDAPRFFPTDTLCLWIDKKSKGSYFFARVRCMEDGKEIWHPGVSGEARRFFKRIPECKSPEYGLYRIGATDFTATVISHCWPKDQISFRARPDLPEDDEAKLTFELLSIRFKHQRAKAELQAKFKIQEEVPDKPADWLTHKARPLEDYQFVACTFSMGMEGSALFMDRGTGKTATAIQRICMGAKRKKGGMYRALIICPNQVRANWAEEFRRFAVVPGKVSTMRGDVNARIKALVQGMAEESSCEFGAVIISFDSAARSVDFLKRVPWDLIIIDESQKFKSPSTNRWKAMKELRDSATERVILSGSPVGNSPMDLWTQLEFLYEGASGFIRFEEFKKFYGVWQNVEAVPGVQRLLALQNMPLLQERLSRLAFQITKKDAGLNLPDKLYDIREVEMTESQARYYKMICEQLAVELKDSGGGLIDEMRVNHVLTQLLRLAQITSGFVVWDAVVDPETGEEERGRKVQQINEENPKIEAVVTDLKAELEEDPNGKKIVWASEVESLKQLYKRFKEEGIGVGLYYGGTSQDKRDELVQRFNKDPEFHVLIANQMTAGEGLDLLGYDKDNADRSHTYCDHEVFFSQNWSSLLRVQAEDRAHRRGTRVPVQITDYVVPGTIDEDIRARVQGKVDMANLVTDINSILSSVLAW
jgi:SNF2 family DNA or RNA helicase